MITLLLLLWLRRKLRGHIGRVAGRLRKGVLLAISCLPLVLLAQETALQYGIYRNAKKIGVLQFNINRQQDAVQLRLESQVHTRMLIGIAVHAFEESRYHQQKLVYSSVRRTVNGSERERRVLTARGTGYQVNNHGTEVPFAHPPIRYSTLSLYAWEPLHVQEVYSDSHQRLLPIRKVGDSHYQVQLPDGRYNEYWYRGGSCRRIVLHNQWYTAEMRLEQITTK